MTGTKWSLGHPPIPTATRPDVPSSCSPRTRAPHCSHSTAPPRRGSVIHITTNTWASSPASLANLPGTVADGRALVYDGLGADQRFRLRLPGRVHRVLALQDQHRGAGTWAAVASRARIGRSRRRAGGAGRHHLCPAGQQQRLLEIRPRDQPLERAGPLPVVAGAGAALASAGPVHLRPPGQQYKELLSLQAGYSTTGWPCAPTVPGMPTPAPR